jgi:hypothetical protein
MDDQNVSYPVFEPPLVGSNTQNLSTINPANIVGPGLLPGSTVIQIGKNNLTIDGGKKNIIVNDGTRNRVIMGYLSDVNDYGLEVFDSSGNVVFNAS